MLTVDRNTPCGIESLRARRARLSIHDLTGVFRVVLRLGRGGAVIHESRLTFRSASLGGAGAVLVPGRFRVWSDTSGLTPGLGATFATAKRVVQFSRAPRRSKTRKSFASTLPLFFFCSEKKCWLKA